jgi:bacteriocin biosynthesis cyclodehydratase domain-containing protein
LVAAGGLILWSDRATHPETRDHRRVPLKLDERFPIVWRSPDSLQLGADVPLVLFEGVSSAQERMIAALAAGVSRPGLSMIGVSAGASESEVVDLLDAVTPALLPIQPPAISARVALCGSGQTADRLEEILRGSGITVDRSEEATTTQLAIIVASYVIEPSAHRLWLSRDIPHLAIVFGDVSVRIGPIVEPGSGPCLHCLELTRTDADPAWPAIASQLWGRSSAAETVLVSSEVAAIAARLAVARLQTPIDTTLSGTAAATPSASTPSASTSVQIDTATGLITRRVWLPHQDCACLALPGNDSAGVPLDRTRPDQTTRSPRTDTDAVALA